MGLGMMLPRRAGVLANAMWDTDLSDLSWDELEKSVPKRAVHDKDEYHHPDPSNSEDKEEMEGYSQLFETLRDTSVVKPASEKDPTEIRSMSTAEQLKLRTAADIC